MATIKRYIVFKPTEIANYDSSNGRCRQSQDYIKFYGNFNGTRRVVSSITIGDQILSSYLNTESNPDTPYVPQYPGSPATKKYVDDNIPTKVSDLTNDSDFQTATQVNQAISAAVSSAYKYKGSVANQAALPASGNTTGDVWNTEDTGMNYAWTGSSWDALGTIVDLSGKQDKLIAGSNIQIASDGKTISATDTKYTAGTGINIDANNVISNTQTSAEWGNITGTLSDQTDLQTALDAKQDDMVILSYGNSTWNDFITAYKKNGVVYCRASSQSNPATGTQGRLAFMAYVNNADSPTEVEFQYYRSRSSHGTAANVLDEVYVYKLVPSNGGTWTVTQRDTAAKPIAGTGIGLTYNASGMTISADTTTLATKTDLNSKQDTLVSGTNIKTVNNESLLGTGNITISAPTYTAGDNITIDQNNEISAVDTTYDAGSGIAIGAAHSDMQGPAPDGFHVPSRNEWIALFETLITTFSMARDATTIGTYLKMPLAGNRNYSSSNVGGKGSIGYYWSSTPYSTNRAYYLEAYSSSLYRQNMGARGYAHSVRCFKDTPVAPDSNWTTLYDGSSIATGAGVFYNSALGLISVSGDGQNWLTIADKNLGATTVYNNGDTLSEANCGYYYKRGNNYGFPFTGSVTTSSTQVDASAYGPGNYYNSSTFIIVNDWSSVQNDNLWGGVSQGTWVGGNGNTIANTGVLSVNGQTGDVTIDTSEASSITTTQPSNPVEGDVYYDTTNDVVKVYDGANWNIVGDDAADINTKTFYLSNTSDLTTAQAAYDWYLAGKNPIIIYDNKSYIIYSKAGSYIYFANSFISSATYQNSVTQIRKNWISFTLSSSTVTAINLNNDYSVTSFLSTTTDYSTPYTPLYDGSPATKKYVDDHAGTTYNAGPGIEIGNVSDYSAMQGPAPDGFHVPLNTEWQAVKDIWTALGGGSSDGTNFGIALKLPFAGYRFCSSAGVGSHGSYGLYWSSSRNNTNNAYLLNFNSSDVLPQNANYRAFGYSVRCFKNSPTVPTSSWTKLYGTSIEAGGIFWSSTEGLISMSSDGQTWITIQDKNLGATTVWNSGDTLSEANCGKYYQRGNNYGFPRTGSVTTSSTQVDASTYGPGNYYSSSTFITRNSSPYRWDTTDNGNLWGGVTGVVTLNNAISNTGVLSVNGQTGDVAISIQEESNTKTFKLANSSDISTAQSAYDRIKAGNYAIVIHGTIEYIFEPTSTTTGRITSRGVRWVQFFESIGTFNETLDLEYLDVTNGVVTGISGEEGRHASGPYVSEKLVAPSNPGAGALRCPEGTSNLQIYDGTQWQPILTGDSGFKLAPNSPLTPKYRRYGTQAQYDALTQYYTDEPGDTVYFTI